MFTIKKIVTFTNFKIIIGFIFWNVGKCRLKLSGRKLEHVQRLACLHITGDICITPTKALEIIVGLEPLTIFIKQEAILASKLCFKLSFIKCLNVCNTLREQKLAICRDIPWHHQTFEAVLHKWYLIWCSLLQAVSMYTEQVQCAEPVVLSVCI